MISTTAEIVYLSKFCKMGQVDSRICRHYEGNCYDLQEPAYCA